MASIMQKLLTADEKQAISKLSVPVSSCEEKRIRMVRACQILDTAIDDIKYNIATSLAIRKLKMKQCSFNVIDINRLWMKSKQNVAESEFDRRYTVCTHVILEDAPDIVVIPDLHQDERFRAWMPKCIQFYAGCPIVVEGYKIGALCVLDSEPHYDFDSNKQSILLSIASIISSKVTEQYHSQLNARCGRPEQLAMNIVYSLKHPLRIIEELNYKLTKKYDDAYFSSTLANGDKVTDIEDPNLQLLNLKDLRASVVELGALIETSLNCAHTKRPERCRLVPHLHAVRHTLQCLLVQSNTLQQLTWQCGGLPADHMTASYCTYPYVLKQVLLCAVLNLSIQWLRIAVEMQAPAPCVDSAQSRTPSLYTEGLRIMIVAKGKKEVPLRGARRVRHEVETGIIVVADLVQCVGGVFSRNIHTNVDKKRLVGIPEKGETDTTVSEVNDISLTHESDGDTGISSDGYSEQFYIHFPCSSVVE